MKTISDHPATSSPTGPTATMDDLVAQRAFVLGLARHLLKDGAAAEDATQETLLAAHRAAPPEGAHRPWLSHVLRNVVRMRARGEGRRRRRESAAEQEMPPPWAPPPPDEASERLDLHRLLIDRVDALDEPYRRTVVLRFFEDRSSADIARAEGVPEGTVRWRLKMGIDRLRADLDERFGQRRRWAALLAPVAYAAPRAETIVSGAAGAARALTPGGISGVYAGLLAVLALIVIGLGSWLAVRAKSSDAAGTSAAGASTEARTALTIRSGWRITPRAPDAATGDVRGRVTDPAGRPVAGAVVTLGSLRPERHVVETVITTADGTYEARGLSAGSFKVAAMRAPFAPAVKSGVSVRGPRVAEVDLQLGADAVTVAGVVRDATGGVIAGAELTLSVMWAENGQVLLRARSGADGRFALASRAGEHQLDVSASGYTSARIDLGHVDSDVDRPVALDPVATLVGHVRERESRRPLAGAEVILIDRESLATTRWLRKPERTDANGRFVIDEVAPGRYDLAARRNAWVTGRVEVTISAADRREGIELLADPGPSVTGRVVDARGAGVPATTVKLAAQVRHEEPDLETTTDAHGDFRFDGVLPGLYEAMLSVTDLGTGRARPVMVDTEGARDVELVRVAPARIVGTVLTEAGRPAAGLRLRMATRGTSDPPVTLTVRGFTHKDGGFAYDVGPGVVEITAGDPELGWARESRTVTAAETHTLTLRLAPRKRGRAVVAGQVLFAGEGPAAGALVRVQAGEASAETSTNAEGRFVLEGLEAGTVNVEATLKHDDPNRGPWNRTQTRVTLGDGERRNDLTLTLPPRRSVAGIVRGPDGSPVAGAVVTAAIEHGGRTERSSGRRVVSDAAGVFVIDDLPEGTVVVWAMDHAHPDVALRGVRTGSRDLVLTFAPAAIARGTVLDVDGQPVRDFHLMAHAMAAGAPFAGTPRRVHDPAGAFELPRLAPGRHLLMAEASGGRRGSLEIEVAAGQTRSDLRLVLQPGGRLEGRIRSASGEPAAGARGFLLVPLGRRAFGCDAEGRFALDGVPRGQLALSVSAGGASRRLDVRVPAQGEAAVPIEVVLPAAEKNPAAGARVR